MNPSQELQILSRQIKQKALQLGFQQAGVSAPPYPEAEKRLQTWLGHAYHGDMAYMARHGLKRSQPDLLHQGTVRVISLRMNYLPQTHKEMETLLQQPQSAYISRYALGRDYHKLMRKRLQKLADWIHAQCANFSYRVLVDSAPVLEKPLAQQAGLGWIGKHTNLINRDAGSWFFLGELYTNLPLPVDRAVMAHCGSCTACLDVCPTQALIAPYQLDARLCISYLTIEFHGSIPENLRPLLGNRIYGCDDCQLVCPWNRFAQLTAERNFLPRQGLQQADLTELMSWSQDEFLRRLEGSAIRRIGHEQWLRNIAIALGNGPANEASIAALRSWTRHDSVLVREHVEWALGRLAERKCMPLNLSG